MKNIILLSIFGVLYQACTVQKRPSSYADSFIGCMEPAEIKAFNSAIDEFEQELNRRYILGSLEKKYKRYVRDISEDRIDTTFWTSDYSTAAIDSIAQNGIFDKVWTRLSEVEMGRDSIQMEEVIMSKNPIPDEDPDIYVIDPEGIYGKCILEKNSSKQLQIYLEAASVAPDISPLIKTNVLALVMEKETNDPSILRTIIAIELYYDIAQLFQER